MTFSYLVQYNRNVVLKKKKNVLEGSGEFNLVCSHSFNPSSPPISFSLNTNLDS